MVFYFDIDAPEERGDKWIVYMVRCGSKTGGFEEKERKK